MPGNIRLWGTTGYVELAAPATGSNTTLTLPTDSIQSGMVLINKTDFSAASSVSVNNCFSSAYENYRIIVPIYSSADTNINGRMRVSGTDNSTSNYADEVLSVSTTVVSASQRTAAAQWIVGVSYTTPGTVLMMDVFAPYLATNTSFWMSGIYTYNTASLRIHGGTFGATTQFDGLSLIPATGTITGSVRVYGYRNSITA